MKAKTIGDTKIGRVREWCMNNPGENLSPTDLREKFGVDQKGYGMLVKRLKAEGLIHPEMVYLATKPAANDDGKDAA